MLLKLCLVCYINRNGCNKLNKIIATFKPHFDNSEFTIFLFHLLPPRSLFSLLQFRQHVECKDYLYFSTLQKEKNREGKAQSLSLPVLYSVLQLGPS